MPLWRLSLTVVKYSTPPLNSNSSPLFISTRILFITVLSRLPHRSEVLVGLGHGDQGSLPVADALHNGPLEFGHTTSLGAFPPGCGCGFLLLVGGGGGCTGSDYRTNNQSDDLHNLHGYSLCVEATSLGDATLLG